MVGHPSTICHPSIIHSQLWPVISPQSKGWSQSFLMCSMPLVRYQWKPWLLWHPQGPTDLQWETACHHHNSFSFDQMFLKLADKGGHGWIPVEFETWPDRIICHRVKPLDCWESLFLSPDFSRRGLLKWVCLSVCPSIHLSVDTMRWVPCGCNSSYSF